jgi:signal recognition particle receptor subunit beta
MTNVHVSPDDIIIAVMGVTGAGKTTFIQEFTSKKLKISHGLESGASTMPASLRAWLLTTERHT